MKMLLRPKEVHVVCGHQRHAEFAAKALGFAQRSSIAQQEMLHFDIQAVAEDFFQFRDPFPFSTVVLAFLCRGTNYRAPTGGIVHSRWQWAQRDHAAMVLRQLL